MVLFATNARISRFCFDDVIRLQIKSFGYLGNTQEVLPQNTFVHSWQLFILPLHFYFLLCYA